MPQRHCCGVAGSYFSTRRHGRVQQSGQLTPCLQKPADMRPQWHLLRRSSHNAGWWRAHAHNGSTAEAAQRIQHRPTQGPPNCAGRHQHVETSREHGRNRGMTRKMPLPPHRETPRRPTARGRAGIDGECKAEDPQTARTAGNPGTGRRVCVGSNRGYGIGATIVHNKTQPGRHKNPETLRHPSLSKAAVQTTAASEHVHGTHQVVSRSGVSIRSRSSLATRRGRVRAQPKQQLRARAAPRASATPALAWTETPRHRRTPNGQITSMTSRSHPRQARTLLGTNVPKMPVAWFSLRFPAGGWWRQTLTTLQLGQPGHGRCGLRQCPTPSYRTGSGSKPPGAAPPLDI